MPGTRIPLPVRLAATPGVGGLLPRLVPPSPKTVLQFAHHAAREKATLADELRRLAVPTLMVWGERDPLGGASVAQAVTELIPDA